MAVIKPLKINTLEQNAKTLKFVSEVKMLLDNGIVRNREEIVRELEWETTTLSNVMNGRRNVPNDIYKKFAEVYTIELSGTRQQEAPPEVTPPVQNGNGEKYLDALIISNEANKALSIANKDLAAAHVKLIGMLEIARPQNSGSEQHISEVLDPYLRVLASALASRFSIKESDLLRDIRKILTGQLKSNSKLGI